jgi:hypothetical protein
MKALFLSFLAVGFVVTAPAARAQASGWIYSPGAPQGPTLSFDAAGENPVHYSLRCAKGALTASQAGATELMDLTNGATVPDTGLSTLPPGAAKLALLTERNTTVTANSSPGFVSAQAAPNAARGWDLSITVPMDDPAVKALAKAKAVALMSTGNTTLVALGADGRTAMSAFLKACKSQ